MYQSHIHQHPNTYLTHNYSRFLLQRNQHSDNMNQVIDESEEGGAIFIGNLEAASNVEYLKSNKIGAVLTVAGGTNLNYNYFDIPLHEVISVDDSLYQDLQ